MVEGSSKSISPLKGAVIPMQPLTFGIQKWMICTGVLFLARQQGSWWLHIIPSLAHIAKSAAQTFNIFALDTVHTHLTIHHDQVFSCRSVSKDGTHNQKGEEDRRQHQQPSGAGHEIWQRSAWPSSSLAAEGLTDSSAFVVTLGYKSTLKSLRSGKAKLVIIAGNTPPLRKSELECKGDGVPTPNEC